MERMRLMVSRETDDLRQRLQRSLVRREDTAIIAASPRACGPAGDLILLDTRTAEEHSKEPLPIRCDGIELTILSYVEVAGHAHEENMLYFAVIPLAYESVKRYAKQPPLMPETQDAAILETIDAWCLRIGVPIHIQGYQYIREAVCIVYSSPDTINSITKTLYPTVAMRFDTSASKVERSIRHAVGAVWKRERKDAISELFGFPVNMHDRKPTNGEFIALLANRCRATAR